MYDTCNLKEADDDLHEAQDQSIDISLILSAALDAQMHACKTWHPARGWCL